MKILICVDVQEGFARYPQTREMSKKIADLTNSGLFDYIIATRFINRNKAFSEIIKWDHLKKYEETRFVDELHYDEVRTKYKYTCVNSEFIARLKEINKGKVPTEVYICGIDTDCCVYKIAIDLFERNIRPIVIEDYCESNGGPESHKAGLTVLRRNIGKDQIKKLSEIRQV